MRISRQTLGLMGAIVLALGVFAPIVRVPLVGDINYYANGNGDGAIVLVLAVGAAALLLAEKYRLVLVPAGLSLGVIAYTFIDLQSRLDRARTALDAIGGPFGDLGGLGKLGTLVGQAVQMQWGWVVMIVGVALLGAAALMPEEKSTPPAPAPPVGPDGATAPSPNGE